MDGNSVKLLIFYITEAITTSTIGFFYRYTHCTHLFKYTEKLHINKNRKIKPFKIAEN